MGKLLLENFHHLVVCTNVVYSYKTSPADGELFMEHYTEYRRGLHQLFPHWVLVPNTHYAGHNPMFMQYWGPLATLSEFPDEHLVGDLEDIPTNHRLRESEGLSCTRV